MKTIFTFTEHEKSEFARMAQAAYNRGFNSIGHRFSAAASLPKGYETTDTKWADTLMEDYRNWLVFDKYPGGIEQEIGK